jgi:DNA-binding beta-propeller fold protein YncE
MLKRKAPTLAAALILASIAAAPLASQTASTDGPKPFEAGRPLGTTADGVYTPMSANVKVYGAIVNAESCSYDAQRKLIVVPSRGANQDEAPNDAYVSLLNSDGSVHTAKWIGATRDGLVLNQPFGSDIHGGRLYLADSDGGTRDGAPTTAVLRMFDMATGAPAGQIVVRDSPRFNDIAVASDGTIYATQTGTADGKTPMRVYRISPTGAATVLLDGAPLARPNGIALDRDGNLVVVNMGNRDVMTFSPGGKLLKTEHAAQPEGDGIVILADGTKYISSVRHGGVSRIRPGKPAELIANGIPNAASMCYDPDANQLVIPMNPNNSVALIKLP